MNWETREVCTLLKRDIISYNSPLSAEDLEEYVTSEEGPAELYTLFKHKGASFENVDWQKVAAYLQQ